jgi:aromatic-L-amino-acid decarboxylase
MLWATSPACTEVETRVLDWLGGALGLPDSFLSTSARGGGVIQGTASDGALVAMVAARERTRRVIVRGQNSPAPELVVYASTQAHSSITKAAMIAGIARGPDDHEHVRLIDVDGQFRMRPDALEAAMREDIVRGRVPFFVCATVGTTGCTAMDDVAAVAEVIERAGQPLPGPPPDGEGVRAWLHVDAAHAGSACVCPEFRPMLRGVERADSISVNPHKWLLTNFDCGCFWTSRREEIVGALSITPEYLRNAASDAGRVIDYRDWQVPLGRRFRAIKLWLVMRWYGVEGLRAHIREHVRLAKMLEEIVTRDERFEMCAPRTLNLLCFRPRPRPGDSREATDTRSRALLDAFNASGCVHLSHCVLPGVGFVLRMCVGGVHTRGEHVREAWGIIGAALDQSDGARKEGPGS